MLGMFSKHLFSSPRINNASSTDETSTHARLRDARSSILQWYNDPQMNEINDISLTFSSRKQIPIEKQESTQPPSIVKFNTFITTSLERIKNQFHRRSTFDPFVQITFKETDETFETFPIYGGDHNVGFTECDHNQFIFNKSQPIKCNNVNIKQHNQSNDYRFSLEVFDSNVGQEDDLIGESDIHLTAETINRLANDEHSKMKNIELFGTASIINKKARFAGKVALSIQKVGQSLQITVLNATNLQNPSLKYVALDQDKSLITYCLICFVSFFAFGIVTFCLIEGWSIWISIWFLIVTITTVGFGDVTPRTNGGKLFNCAYLLMSTVLLGWAFSVMMNYLLEMNTRKLKLKKTNPALSNQDKLKQFKKSLIVNFCFMCLFLVIGLLFFSFIAREQWNWIDSLHFCVICIATVGYGNRPRAPTSPEGRVFCCFFMLFGIVLLARFASNIMEYLLQKRHNFMVQQVMNNALVSQEQIAQFDQDQSGTVDKYEYLSKMLILTNEVKKEVIDNLMKKFREIDRDNDGCIDVSDFRVSIERAHVQSLLTSHD